LFGVNVVDVCIGYLVFLLFVIECVDVGYGECIKVGVLGFINFGIVIWDKVNVEGKLKFFGFVE